MSFLDSLENNLKAMEGTEASGLDDRMRRENERQRAVASAPWARKLRSAAYAQALMERASRAGYKIRTKVNVLWIGDTLRLEARGHRLELRPTPEGILAVRLKHQEEVKRELIDLAGTPDALLEELDGGPGAAKERGRRVGSTRSRGSGVKQKHCATNTHE